MTKMQSTWPDGPWDTEPDHEEFEAHGVKCEVKRHPEAGHLCGYVTVPEGHPWLTQKGEYASTLAEEVMSVHGGVTYFHERQAGWDYAHCDDLVPGHISLLGPRRQGTYATWSKVREDVVQAAYRIKVAQDRTNFTKNKARIVLDQVKHPRRVLAHLLDNGAIDASALITAALDSGEVRRLDCCGEPNGWCCCGV